MKITNLLFLILKIKKIQMIDKIMKFKIPKISNLLFFTAALFFLLISR